MRQIGSLTSEPDARRFVDFLIAQGVAASAEATNGATLIWVRDEDHVSNAKAELEKFLADPSDARYQNHALTAARRLREEDARRKQASRNIIEVRNSWSRMALAGKAITTTLIVLSVFVSLITEFGKPRNNTMGSTAYDRLSFRSERTEAGMATPLAEVARGEWWRLITPIFLHGDMLHLVFNMLWLFELGGMVERRRGSLMFAALVLFTALVSNTGQALMPSAMGGSPFAIGMSGVVYGVFGYLWIGGMLRPEAGMRLSPNIEMLMIVFLLLGFTQILDRLLGMQIANWAHLYGLFAGAGFVYVEFWLRHRPAS